MNNQDVRLNNMTIQEHIGTYWRHKKKKSVYCIDKIREGRNEVYLRAISAGSKSTWKYLPLLPFDYDLVESNGESLQPRLP